MFTLFLSRHLILLMLIGVSAGRGGGGPRNPELAGLLDPVFFVSDLPALFLLFVELINLRPLMKNTVNPCPWKSFYVLDIIQRLKKGDHRGGE